MSSKKTATEKKGHDGQCWDRIGRAGNACAGQIWRDFISITVVHADMVHKLREPQKYRHVETEGEPKMVEPITALSPCRWYRDSPAAVSGDRWPLIGCGPGMFQAEAETANLARTRPATATLVFMQENVAHERKGNQPGPEWWLYFKLWFLRSLIPSAIRRQRAITSLDSATTILACLHKARDSSWSFAV